MTNFYVYLHVNAQTNEIFYVGKGNGNRANARTRRSDRWKSYVNKYGYHVHIVKDCLSNEDALELEELIIKLLGRKDNGSGPLINMTDGGEGGKGKIPSPETRLKMSIAAKGRKMSNEQKKKLSDANKGKSHSAESRKKQSDSLKKTFSTGHPSKGRTLSEKHKANIGKGVIGNTHSEETKQRISESKRGKTLSEETKQKIRVALIQRRKTNMNNF
jgi:hypothetical protein